MAFDTMARTDGNLGKVSLQGNHALEETRQIPLSEQRQWELLFPYPTPNTTTCTYTEFCAANFL